MLFLFSLFLNLLPLCLLFGTFVRCASPRLFLMSHFLQKCSKLIEPSLGSLQSLNHTHFVFVSPSLSLSLSLSNSLCQTTSLDLSLPPTKHTILPALSLSLSLLFSLSLARPLSTSRRRRRRPCCCCCCRRRRCCCTIF